MHFDKIAVTYSSYSNSGVWSFIRKIEAQGVINLLPKIDDNTTALDLGCGVGYYSHVLRKHGIKNITCVDFSEKMLSQITADDCQKIQANIEEYQNTKKYDIIICAGALEFTKDAQRVFENVSSMLTSSGCFVLLYPKKNILGHLYRFYHKMHGFAIRLYDENELHLFSKNVGLTIGSSNDVFPFARVTKYI